MTTHDYRNAIRAAVCEHMPTAAVASGLLSTVDVAGWVAEISERFPPATRTASLGLPGLVEWLKAQGVTCGVSHARALRLEWLKERMRDAADAGFAAKN